MIKQAFDRHGRSASLSGCTRIAHKRCRLLGNRQVRSSGSNGGAKRTSLKRQSKIGEGSRAATGKKSMGLPPPSQTRIPPPALRSAARPIPARCCARTSFHRSAAPRRKSPDCSASRASTSTTSSTRRSRSRRPWPSAWASCSATGLAYGCRWTSRALCWRASDRRTRRTWDGPPGPSARPERLASPRAGPVPQHGSGGHLSRYDAIFCAITTQVTRTPKGCAFILIGRYLICAPVRSTGSPPASASVPARPSSRNIDTATDQAALSVSLSISQAGSILGRD